MNNLLSKMSGAATNGSAKKVLVVFGATGKQGGSVVKSVLGDPKSASIFSVRAVTRDPSKPSAQALSKLGAECVTVSLVLRAVDSKLTVSVPRPTLIAKHLFLVLSKEPMLSLLLQTSGRK